MKILAIILSGVTWAMVAAFITGIAGGQLSAAKEVAPIFLAPSIVTSALVTWLFRKQLFVHSPKRNFGLPFLTILTAVPIFVISLYLMSVARWMVNPHFLGSPLDGFLYAIVTGVFLSLSVALPITYPVAYLTQVFMGWSGRRRIA